MLAPITEKPLEHAGGKATGLRALVAAGLPVPPAWCLSAEVYRQALPTRLPAADGPLDRIGSVCAQLYAQLAGWQPTPALEHQLRAALERCSGGPLIVRSSASCEDRPGRSAAGIFRSVPDADDLDRVVSAIRLCWRSLWEPLAWAVLRAQGGWPGDEAMAVVLQAQIPAACAGLLRSRDLRRRDQVRLEAVAGGGAVLAEGSVDPHVLLLPREGAIPADAVGRTPLSLAAAQLERLRDLAIAGEAALSTSATGQLDAVELEWVCQAGDKGALWLVQARPQQDEAAGSYELREPAFTVRSDQDTGIGKPPDDATLWRWDREHNAEPLSAAHASLIELLVERSDQQPALAVFGGYLYERIPASPTDPAPTEPGDLEGELAALATLAAPSSGKAAGNPAQQLQAALDRFARFYLRYSARLGPMRRAARDRLRTALGALSGEDEPQLVIDLSLGQPHDSLTRTQALEALAEQARGDAALRGWIEATGDTEAQPRDEALPPVIADHLAHYGALSPRWDVAEPTLAEQPWTLRALLARMLGESPSAMKARTKDRAERIAARTRRGKRRLDQLLTRSSAADREALQRSVHAARLARASAEDDDLLFARALWQVRAALFAAAEALMHSGSLDRRDQVFDLSLPVIMAGLQGQTMQPPLRSQAVAANALHRQRQATTAPLTIRGAHREWTPSASGDMLRGLGHGDAVEGHARVVRDPSTLLAADLRGLVLVCPTLLPALAPALPQLRAIVTDHGGLLSHAALLAREMGVTAVVGTQTATRLLRDGDRLWVDGTGGSVVRLESPANRR